MALQTFTAGQVLTAAQLTALQTNDYNQTVSAKTANYTLVAADKGTRITMSSATDTTITVNTSLFAAGDSLRIQNLNGGGLCTITAGTATVTSAGSLVLPSWGGGQLFFSSASAAVWFPDATASGLALIKTQTIGSAVTSIAVTGAFSTNYDNYKVIVYGGVGSADVSVQFQLGSTTTGYYGSFTDNTFAGASGGGGFANQANFQNSGRANTNTLSMVMELQQPFLTKNTLAQWPWIVNNTTGRTRLNGGYLDNSTSYTGFTIIIESGTVTGGTIAVYGYTKV